MERSERHRRIVDVLSRNEVSSQDELLDLLEAEGVRTTQSTLSRDLREIGVVKGTRGYRLPESDPTRPESLRQLAGALRPRLRSIDVGGNLVVLRTDGADEASAVAEEFERTKLHQAVQALAIGDTVLVVGRSDAYARDIARALRKG